MLHTAALYNEHFFVFYLSKEVDELFECGKYSYS